MGRTGQQMRQRTIKRMASSRTIRTGKRRQLGRSARWQYWFDNTMSRGTPALVGWLAVVTFALIGLFTVIVTVARWSPANEDGTRPGFFRQLFNSLLHALDPGTIAGDSGGGTFLFAMLLLTLGGLFIVSALIGVIATGIDNKLDQLRRGRSVVLEKDHTVILGWSDSVFAILRELSIANESRRRPAIVVLAERDKVEMETDIRDRVPDLLGTRVVCRTGSPLDLGDLALTNLGSARSAIVLAPGGEDPDSEVIKTLLALTREDGGLSDDCRVVAEIQDPTNLEAARLVGRRLATIVDKRETIARLIVQTSRQSGAAAVYRELFDFEGDEIYFHTDPALAAATFADARVAYESASVIGLAELDGKVTLNPPADAEIGNRELVVIAEDDSVLDRLDRSTAEPELEAINTSARTRDSTTRVLLLGWNERASTVVSELDLYAAPGSSIDILTEMGEPDVPKLRNLTATVAQGRTSDRSVLARYPILEYHQVVVLAYSDHLSGQRADARTLVTLLHLREIVGDRARGEGPSVVSEMQDDRNRALAQVAHVDDVIVSDEILSLIVSQLSENARLETVFADLLNAGGAEIYLRPATDYVIPGRTVSYRTVLESAALRGETAIGYRVAAEADDPDAAFGVYVNPPKAQIYDVKAADRVVVLADE